MFNKFAKIQNSSKNNTLTAETDYAKIPLSFEENRGQAQSEVKFLSRGNGYALFLTPDEAVFALKKGENKSEDKLKKANTLNSSIVLKMKLHGANPAPQISGQDEIPAKSNYFQGNDSQNWRQDVSNFSKVRYEEVYPGIDQIFYGNGRELEYDFVVSPGAETDKITVSFEGAENLKIDENGDLILNVRGEEIRQKKPFVYQEIGGERREIAAKYSIQNPKSKIQNPMVGFEIGEYDPSKMLVIDPILVYSTYLGGSGSDLGTDIAVDGEGNAYITGLTWSANFPVKNAVKSVADTNRGDVFVTQINSSGSEIVFSTFIGGSVGDIGHGIDIDNQGNVYVTGVTGASIDFNDFPTVNAYDNTFGGTDDVFLLKLNPAGNQLLYSTYLGGSNTDVAYEVKVNKTTGEAVIVGDTLSVSQFPTTSGAYRTTCQGCVSTPFVTKFNAEGSNLVYSTFVGPGSPNDLALDAEGNVYLTGSTVSNSFPITPGAPQPICTGCEFLRADAFITKLNAQGSALVYSTYLGGSVRDVGNAIAVDAEGNAYVTGQTESTSLTIKPFPTTTGVIRPRTESRDAFVTKINAAGTEFVYSTFLGGEGTDQALGIAVDAEGKTYTTGFASSHIGFPLVGNFNPPFPAGIFITVLNNTASAAVFSSFLGGGEGRDVEVDGKGGIYLTGEVLYDRLLPRNALQPAPANGNTSVSDAFVTKINLQSQSTRKPAFDFDGDGRSDISVFRPETGVWYVLQSQFNNASIVHYGRFGDKLAPADFDGDGKTDFAVFRNGLWFVQHGFNETFEVRFGLPGDKPVPGDFDGDGRDDIAVFRPSNGTWYWLQSSDGGFRAAQFGLNGDIPVIADFDGDRKTDLSVFRRGVWYWLRSS
ncbi:MAG TPA: SBBP repeat-containing protein, partial [Pyrinomonadaceae bacterium]|nr:SBBP repeat-containing protein [Pyrinomonadaceae bacterium]